MKHRLVALELGAITTATHCGDCGCIRRISPQGTEHGRWSYCTRFSPDESRVRREELNVAPWYAHERLEECIAAEARVDAMFYKPVSTSERLRARVWARLEPALRFVREALEGFGV